MAAEIHWWGETGYVTPQGPIKIMDHQDPTKEHNPDASNANKRIVGKWSKE